MTYITDAVVRGIHKLKLRVLLRVVDDANYTGMIDILDPDTLEVRASYPVSSTGNVVVEIDMPGIYGLVRVYNSNEAGGPDENVFMRLVYVGDDDTYWRTIYIGKGVKWVRLIKAGGGLPIVDSYITDEESIDVPPYSNFLVYNYSSRKLVIGYNKLGEINYKVVNGRWGIVRTVVAVREDYAEEYFYRLASRFNGAAELAMKIRYNSSLTSEEKVKLLTALWAKMLEAESELGVLKIGFYKKTVAEAGEHEKAAIEMTGLAVSDTDIYYVIEVKSYVRFDIDWNKVLGAALIGAGIGAIVGTLLPGIGTSVGAFAGGAIAAGIALITDYSSDNMVPSTEEEKGAVGDAIDDAETYLDQQNADYNSLVTQLYTAGKIDEETKNTLLAWWNGFYAGMRDKLETIRQVSYEMIDQAYKKGYEAAKNEYMKWLIAAAGGGFIAGAIITK